ncbi:MAG: AmmeMemoRadiSam system radical SAM enzyme, partial [Candidatus Nitrosotenuis sp.]
NGYDTPQTVKMMGEFLDCITVDFKGSAEPQFTRKYIGVPDPKPIFDSLIEIKDKTKIHVEITDLIVPQVGDSIEYARKLARFLYDQFGPEIPIHFLRFHPDYKMMDFPITPIKTLEKHYEVAKEEGLQYVYIGNSPGHPYEHTYCPGCRGIAVGRYGFDITEWNLDKDNKCVKCGYKIPIFGSLDPKYRRNRFQFVV